MRDESPYRAAGTFAGELYVERGADRALQKAIRANQRYPYVVAPRQSGKSSLLVRALEALDPKAFRGTLVDLSPYSLDDYAGFWRRFLLDIARGARLDATLVQPEEPEETFRAWLGAAPERLVVFVDEIDALVAAPFRDLFFSKIRSLFNQRALDAALGRLQFVLAGATHPTRLIQDHMRSPFNVGIEIELDNLSVEQVRKLASHLADACARVDEDVGAAIHAETAGLPFLCQLVLERLWAMAEEQPRIGASEVRAAVEAIARDAPRDVHFTNIYALVGNNGRLLSEFMRLGAGEQIPEMSRQDLRLTGLTDGKALFRSELYRRVFGAGGPLDLLKLAAPSPPAEREDALESAAVEEKVPAPAKKMAEEARAAPPQGKHFHKKKPRTEQPRISMPPGLEPLYPDDETRALSEQLDSSYQRLAALASNGLPTEGVEREIQDLHRRLREGGLLRAGDSLGGARYLLLAPIGRGFVASVWRAWDRSDEREVALKVLHPTLSGDPVNVERFFAAAEKTASIEHPALLRVLEPRGWDGSFHYFVMEPLRGGDLWRKVREERIAPREVLEIVLAVGDALAAVHARGMVHGNVEPANVLFDEKNRPRLSELGWSPRESAGATKTTKFGTIFFTDPAMRGELSGAEPTADVYSLGMTLARVLPDGHTFDTNPISAIKMSCGPAVVAVVAKAIADNPKDRFPEAASMCSALRAAIEADGRVPLVAAKPEPMSFGPFADEPKKARPPQKQKTKRIGGLRALVAIAAALGAIGGAAVYRYTRPPPLAVLGLETVKITSSGPPLHTAPTRHARGMRQHVYGLYDAGAGAASDQAPCSGEMVHVPPREGDGGRGFCIDRVEVTINAYRRCVERGACGKPAEQIGCTIAQSKVVFGMEGASMITGLPVNCVTFADAANFCSLVDKRLPTEAEWEYAAKGHDSRPFPWGSAPPSVSLLNACDRECKDLLGRLGNSVPAGAFLESDHFAAAAPVGSFPLGASPFRALDMAGNVAEWVDGGACAPDAGDCSRPALGGSWSDGGSAIAAHWRQVLPAEHSSPTVGFRCVR